MGLSQAWEARWDAEDINSPGGIILLQELVVKAGPLCPSLLTLTSLQTPLLFPCPPLLGGAPDFRIIPASADASTKAAEVVSRSADPCDPPNLPGEASLLGPYILELLLSDCVAQAGGLPSLCICFCVLLA